MHAPVLAVAPMLLSVLGLEVRVYVQLLPI